MNAPAVLFDFDGTLVRGDCVTRFLLRYLLRTGVVRRAVALLALPLLAPLFLWWRSAIVPAGFYGWLATVGRSEASLRRQRERFLDECAARREQLLIHSAVACLQQHRADGVRVLVVTGAEENLARELWRALGGPEVEFVGSRTRRALGGRLPVRHCVGPRKLRALREHGVQPPFAAMYSDSARDLPLLRQAQRPVLVCATPALRRRLAAALPGLSYLD